MKKITSLCIVTILLVTTSCRQRDVPLPADFAIKIEGGFRDIVDTFNEKYTRSAVAPEMRDSTVNFEFTIQEKDSIYRALNKINYIALPERVPTQCESFIEPRHTLKITIRENEIVKHIFYDDGCFTRNKQALAFSKVLVLIDAIAARHKEVQQIPRTMMMDM